MLPAALWGQRGDTEHLPHEPSGTCPWGSWRHQWCHGRKFPWGLTHPNSLHPQEHHSCPVPWQGTQRMMFSLTTAFVDTVLGFLGVLVGLRTCFGAVFLALWQSLCLHFINNANEAYFLKIHELTQISTGKAVLLCWFWQHGCRFTVTTWGFACSTEGVPVFQTKTENQQQDCFCPSLSAEFPQEAVLYQPKLWQYILQKLMCLIPQFLNLN